MSTRSPPLVLTPKAPQADVPVPSFTVAPSTCTITISTIENPSLQGFGVQVQLHFTGNDGSSSDQLLGSFSPFPPDQPGSFRMRVPTAAQSLLTRKDGVAKVRLTLLPVDAQRPLVDPLKVTFADPVWGS